MNSITQNNITPQAPRGFFDATLQSFKLKKNGKTYTFKGKIFTIDEIFDREYYGRSSL